MGITDLIFVVVVPVVILTCSKVRFWHHSSHQLKTHILIWYISGRQGMAKLQIPIKFNSFKIHHPLEPSVVAVAFAVL